MGMVKRFVWGLALAVLAMPALGQDLRPKPRPVNLVPAQGLPDPGAASLAVQDAALPQGFAVPLDLPRPARRMAEPIAPAVTGPDVLGVAAVLAAPLAQGEAVPRPRQRPVSLKSPVAMAALSSPVLEASIRPRARPANLARSRPAAPERVQPAAAAIVRPAPGLGEVAGPQGSVCGNPDIRGQRLSPIAGRIAGCGIKEPVRITSVAGVRLLQPATVNCTTAQALNTWVERGLKPAFGRTGGGVVALNVPAHYACRTRNHRKGAKLSEHAKGNAIDISVIHLANGQQVPVLRGFRGAFSRQMRAAHKAACGIFGTTLGPGSDGMHEDHFHYDVARHRGGPSCR